MWTYSTDNWARNGPSDVERRNMAAPSSSDELGASDAALFQHENFPAEVREVHLVAIKRGGAKINGGFTDLWPGCLG